MFFYFRVSTWTATTALVRLNAFTSRAGPFPNDGAGGGIDAWISIGCNGSSPECPTQLQSYDCLHDLPICSTYASWTDQAMEVPANVNINIYMGAQARAQSSREVPARAMSWALANLSMQLDPAFQLANPEARILFTSGVDQTGPNTLPVGGTR
jgi:hypothetical protein